MLFSQPELAEFLSASFECAWESVRPVPRLTVDFGDGRVLERTLRGNIATYVCSSDGGTLDLIPGLMDAREYRWRLGQALWLHRAVGAASTGATARALVAAWHAQQGASAASAAPRAASGGTDFVSKFRVENVLEQALAAVGPPPRAPLPAGLERDLSKRLVEAPLLTSLGFDAAGLELDTSFAREQGHARGHAFLAARVLCPPREIERDVYRELLHVDLADPYLGLAPAVLGGEPGRH